jgi:tetratricopeptide (TPR) repeat protein
VDGLSTPKGGETVDFALFVIYDTQEHAVAAGRHFHHEEETMRGASALLLIALFGLGDAAWGQWTEDAQNCFELTKPGSMDAAKALPFCERAIQSGKLINRNLATVYYYRGTIYTQRRDHVRAIQDYGEAVRLDPLLTQGYINRGFARFFLGQFAAAVPDFSRAVRQRPDDIYANLWNFIVQSRSGIDGVPGLLQNATNFELENWPGQIVSMYLGHLGPQEVIKAAVDLDPKKQRDKKCEAYFYSAELFLIQGKKSEAIKMLKAAVAANAGNIVEVEAAKVELKRLGG